MDAANESRHVGEFLAKWHVGEFFALRHIERVDPAARREACHGCFQGRRLAHV